MDDDDLINLVAKVFDAEDSAVPRFASTRHGSFAALSFIQDTLATQVYRNGRGGDTFTSHMRFNRELLMQRTDSGKGLPHLLMAKLKPLFSRSSTFERAPERRVLSRCLLYALRLKPRVPVADIELLLELFSDASYFKRPNEAADDFWCSGRLVMFCTLQALLPEESTERALQNTDESLLESLAASTVLANYFQGTPAISDPMRLVLQFAYVLLQMRCSSRTTQVASQERLDDCYKVGVFNALYKVLTDHIFSQGMTTPDQILCFEISYRLLTMLFEVESRRLISQRHVLYESTTKYIKHPTEEAKSDNYLNLVHCLSLIFSHCPNVIIQPDSEQARNFIAWIPDSGFLKQSPQFLVGFIDLIASLANGEEGADRIFTQMIESARNKFSITSEGFKYICWDFILESFVTLCRVLTGIGTRKDAAIRSEELEGFGAYLRLFGKIFSNSSHETTRQRVELLENEFKSSLESQKLKDLFLVLFCKSVPHPIKSAACKAIAGIGRSPELALSILKNLKFVGLFAAPSEAIRVTAMYLAVQLSSVEATMLDYSFTISCIEMANQLLQSVEKLDDRETCLVEVTLFCKDVLLEAIWNHLSFNRQEQLWELLANAFEHFVICLERMEYEDFTSSEERTSPSQLVLHDILSRGAIYKSICSCISKAFIDRGSNRFPTNAANKAVTNAIDLMLEVFRKEGRVQHPPSVGFLSFKDSIISNNELVQRSLYNVSSGLPKELQYAAVELMKELYGKTPEKFDALDIQFQALLMQELPKLFDDNISVMY